MRKFLSFRDFDWTLLAFVLLICLLGVIQIYSATNISPKFSGMHIKQIYWILAGLVAMFVMCFVDYQLLVENVHWAYFAGIFALLSVMLFGTKALGAKRWIQLPGGQHFQPSEWMKLVLILLMARYFSALNQRDITWPEILKACALVAIPMAFVLKQPDLGTALTYLPILGMGLFLGGMKWKQAAIIFVVGMVAVLPVWKWGLKPYQKDRLVVFLHPENDSKKTGYQIQQSLIAVGSGGITGKGVAKGSQTQGMFLPVTHTDFIFAAFSEEHGFVGALGALLLYFMVLMRLIQNAQTAPDRAGTMVVMGVAALFAFHILVNVGMVVGFMPVTGIPLPLMSYGGSSVLFMFLALGIVLNIRMRRFVN